MKKHYWMHIQVRGMGRIDEEVTGHRLVNDYWELHTVAGSTLLIRKEDAVTITLSKEFTEILKEAQNEDQAQTQE